MTTNNNKQDIRSNDNRKQDSSDAQKQSSYSNDNAKKESGSMNPGKQHTDANQGKFPDEKRPTEYCGSEDLRDDGCKTDKTARDRNAKEGLESEKLREQGRTANNQNQPNRSDSSSRKDDERSKYSK